MKPNSRLRLAREACPSPADPSEPMSRAELAEAVSEYLWRTTGTHSALDAHAIARYERGRVTWPSARYRAGLRAVLGVPTDAGLGFHAVRRRRGPTSKAETFSPNGAVRAEGSGMDSEDLLVLDAALTLVEHAQVREDRLSRSTRAMLWTLRARTLALRGTFHAVEDNIVRADECFALRDPKYAPPWLCYYDEAEHYGSTGKALIPLAVDSRRPEVAASRLRRAVTMHDSRYRRSRVFSSIRLASLLLAVGDPAEAVSVGHQALPDAKRLRSARIATELAGLARVAGTHDQREDIAELRHEASAAASAAT